MRDNSGVEISGLWRVALLLILACGALCSQDFEQAWHGDRLTLRVRASAVGNLTWQLDTLAGHSNTRPKDYEDLWHKDLAWNAEDAHRLAQWSALYDRYRHRATKSRRVRSPYPQNYARFYGDSVGRDYSFRIAALNAPDLEALRKSYQQLCGRACADGFLTVLQHFWPRFSEWWRQEGLPTATMMIPQIVSRAADAGIGALLEAGMRVTGAELPAHPDVALDIAVHPKKYLTNYTATVMESHVLTEVVDDPEVGGPRLPLVIHELTHHYYDFAPRGEHARLVDRFITRPEPWSMAAYSVLNEVLATAVQLLAEKSLRPAADYAAFIQKDDNVYFDPFIARISRAAAPLVAEWMEAKKNIFDDGFVDAYLRVVTTALGPLSDSPRFLLSSRVLISGPAGQHAKDEFVQNVRGIVGQEEWKDLQASPHLSGVVFVTEADLKGLEDKRKVLPAAILAEVQSAARAHTAFAFAWQRSPKAWIYVLFGQDEKQLLEVTKRFVLSDTPLTGFR